MNSRERLLSIVLGGFILVGVVGLFAYLLVLSPLEEKAAAIGQLEAKVAEKTEHKDKIDAGNRRLAVIRRSSLPPEPNTAQREYDFVLTAILGNAGVPASARTVNVKMSTDKTTVPLVNPGAPSKEKRYAYQKVVADITMTRVRLDSLTRFLTAYQRLGLLHHITKITVKGAEAEGGGGSIIRGGRGGGGGGGDRNDLTVSLTSEAIILDGVDPRESIIPIPRPVQAIGGAAVYIALDANPDVGRRLVLNRPYQSLPSESNSRNYDQMTWKDPFHGSVPPPVITNTRPPDPPPLPGIEQHIRMSGWATNSDGSGKVDITDMANNVTYKIALSRKGEKLHTSVSKQRVVEGRVVTFNVVPGSDPEVKSWVNKPFTISDAEMAVPSSTKRTFTIHGLVPQGIILSSNITDEKTAAPAAGRGGFGGGRGGGRGGIGGGRGGGFGNGPVTATRGTPLQNAIAAVTGGPISVQPFETYYVWTIGQTLRDVLSKEVPKKDVDELLKHALAPLMPDAAVTASSRDGR